MKKLLVLTLVLGIASLASAGISIVPSSLDLTPGNTTTVSIVLDADTNLMGYDMILMAEGPGTINGSEAVLAVGHSWMSAPSVVADERGFRWTAADVPMFGGQGQTGGIVSDNFIFTCTDLGDVTLSLYSVASTLDGADLNGQTLASVVISQVPEPATLALLGLGVLALRRKK